MDGNRQDRQAEDRGSKKHDFGVRLLRQKPRTHSVRNLSPLVGDGAGHCGVVVFVWRGQVGFGSKCVGYDGEVHGRKIHYIIEDNIRAIGTPDKRMQPIASSSAKGQGERLHTWRAAMAPNGLNFLFKGKLRFSRPDATFRLGLPACEIPRHLLFVPALPMLGGAGVEKGHDVICPGWSPVRFGLCAELGRHERRPVHRPPPQKWKC